MAAVHYSQYQCFCLSPWFSCLALQASVLLHQLTSWCPGCSLRLLQGSPQRANPHGEKMLVYTGCASRRSLGSNPQPHVNEIATLDLWPSGQVIHTQKALKFVLIFFRLAYLKTSGQQALYFRVFKSRDTLCRSMRTYIEQQYKRQRFRFCSQFFTSWTQRFKTFSMYEIDLQILFRNLSKSVLGALLCRDNWSHFAGAVCQDAD